MIKFLISAYLLWVLLVAEAQRSPCAKSGDHRLTGFFKLSANGRSLYATDDGHIVLSSDHYSVFRAWDRQRNHRDIDPLISVFKNGRWINLTGKGFFNCDVIYGRSAPPFMELIDMGGNKVMMTAYTSWASGCSGCSGVGIDWSDSRLNFKYHNAHFDYQRVQNPLLLSEQLIFSEQHPL
ncbi:hypothetical protein K7432_014517 [Basidiobolus ranarum]|uniref:Uncharacterized protein n=1 Tax=Basidiobolus ranarum TaxID=34480 RepID=A0ABR2VPF4_9FUNG